MNPPGHSNMRFLCAVVSAVTGGGLFGLAVPVTLADLRAAPVIRTSPPVLSDDDTATELIAMDPQLRGAPRCALKHVTDAR